MGPMNLTAVFDPFLMRGALEKRLGHDELRRCRKRWAFRLPLLLGMFVPTSTAPGDVRCVADTGGERQNIFEDFIQ